jgi:DUF4097 and DUF4098 domain-containing protein YvlB
MLRLGRINMEEQRKRILKLVEEGKLSANEAITLIETLESDEQLKEEKMNALSTEVIGDPYEEKTEQSNEKQSSLGAMLMDWVDTAVKRVKELDLDLNFGKSIDVKHIFQFQDSPLQVIDITLPNGSVNLQPWNESDIRVECDAKVYRAENMAQARQTFLTEVECFVEGNQFVLRTDKKTMKINVTMFVPEQEYEHIKIKLFNGPIRGEDLKVDNLKVKTANGLVSFSAINAIKGEFETANGQIKLTNSSYGKLEAETISGIIQFNGSAKKVDVQSFNGNLMLKLADKACEELYTKTTTGNIVINMPEGSEVIGDLKSNLGSLSARLQDVNITSEKNEAIQKELKFKTSQEPKLSLFADSKTGSISIK